MYVAALCVARTAELLLGAVYIYAKKLNHYKYAVILVHIMRKRDMF